MGLTWEVRIYRKTQDPAASIATIAAAIEEDHPFTGGSLLSFTGLSFKTIHRILNKNLGLSKDTERWVPKLPVHLAAVVQQFFAKRISRTSPTQCIGHIWLQQTFSYFLKWKTSLAGKNLTQEIIIRSWVGVIRKQSKDDFTTPLEKLIDNCKKCKCLEDGYMKKS